MTKSFTTIATASLLTLISVVPAFAATAPASGQRMLPETTKDRAMEKVEKKVAKPAPKDGVCVGKAVGIREDSLIAARTTANAAIITALGTRKTELMASWAIADTEARRTSRQAAWKKFQTTSDAARKALRADTSAAYTQFNASVKACGVQYSEQPSSTEAL